MEVDFEEHKKWAKDRFGVETEPTFIFLYNNHEIKRIRSVGWDQLKTTAQEIKKKDESILIAGTVLLLKLTNT